MLNFLLFLYLVVSFGFILFFLHGIYFGKRKHPARQILQETGFGPSYGYDDYDAGELFLLFILCLFVPFLWPPILLVISMVFLFFLIRRK